MFLLLLMGLGAAGVKAQVRIGGNASPNAAAVLDLNANDDATPAANKGALALPRVSLASTTAQLNGAMPITGMLVYNTNNTLGAGIYFWDGVSWIPLATLTNSTYPPYALLKVLDTTVNVPAIAVNSWASISAPRVLAGDMCPLVAGASGSGFVVLAAAKSLYLGTYSGSSATPAQSTHIWCFRPTPL